jgi:hypothetical protein
MPHRTRFLGLLVVFVWLCHEPILRRNRDRVKLDYLHHRIDTLSTPFDKRLNRLTCEQWH